MNERLMFSFSQSLVTSSYSIRFDRLKNVERESEWERCEKKKSRYVLVFLSLSVWAFLSLKFYRNIGRLVGCFRCLSLHSLKCFEKVFFSLSLSRYFHFSSFFSCVLNNRAPKRTECIWMDWQRYIRYMYISTRVRAMRWWIKMKLNVSSP